MDEKRNTKTSATPVAISRRLRTQLILMFVAISLLMILGVGLVTYREVEKVLENQSAGITNQYLMQSEYNILSLVDEMDLVSKNIMLSSDLDEYLTRGWQGDFQSIEIANRVFQQCSQAMMGSEAIHSLYFWADSGSVLGITPNSQMVSSTSYQPQPILPESLSPYLERGGWYSQWVGGLTSRDFAGNHRENSEDSNLVHYVTFLRRFYISHSHSAVMVLNIDESALADTFTKADIGQQRETYLVDDRGMVLSHRDASLVGATFRFDLHGEEAQNSSHFTEGDLLINFYPIDSLGWYIISEVPRSVVYREINSIQQLFVLAIMIMLVIALVFSQYWIYRLTKPLDGLRDAMQRMEEGKLGGQLPEDSGNELGMLGRQFNKMSKSIQQLITQIKNIEGEKRDMEMEALQAQINPHFLYNTLSNIKYMAMLDNAGNVADALTSLGCLLRPLYNSHGEFWSIETELGYLQNYIAVMNYRFGGMVQMDTEVDESLLEVPILKFILQPLTENAIEHNTKAEGHGWHIGLSIGRQGGLVCIEVRDNGSGIPPDKLAEIRAGLATAGKTSQKPGGVGLYNVHRRIQSTYGSPYGLTVESGEGLGTRIRLSFPQNMADAHAGILEQES